MALSFTYPTNLPAGSTSPNMDFHFGEGSHYYRSSNISFNIDVTYLPNNSPNIQHIFRQLVDEWDDAVGDTATISDRFMHRAYQHIIGLGPNAVPLLLRELEREPNYWFWALAAITRENPVHSGASFDEAVEAWLDWGRKKGMI